jgi:hypothetical protein
MIPEIVEINPYIIGKAYQKNPSPLTGEGEGGGDLN